jgi:glyoxylase-like metal-dependent hydrolase (beta-lactamase superfamily II)
MTSLPARDHLADDVFRLRTLIANVYYVGQPGAWILVDAGLAKSARAILRVAEERFGPNEPPLAIILTHGHADHSGSAGELAAYWNAPIYAHPLEMPYLTGKSHYPPGDPTVGGVGGLYARLVHPKMLDLGDRVAPLPDDGSVPGAPEWRWLHTAGHTSGHVALFRESDRVLLAGDALSTADLDAPLGLMARTPGFYRPVAPFTSDWYAAESSMHALAGLEPSAVGAGHGHPYTGPHTARRLHEFVDRFQAPAKGRYVRTPARADTTGVIYLPPVPPDPLPKTIVIAVAAGALLAALAITRKRSG